MREIVSTYKSVTGRGPTQAKSHWIVDGDPFLLVTLRGLYTMSEESLISQGRFDLVEQGRRAMHRSAEASLELAAERALSREVKEVAAMLCESPPMGFLMFHFASTGPLAPHHN